MELLYFVFKLSCTFYYFLFYENRLNVLRIKNNENHVLHALLYTLLLFEIFLKLVSNKLGTVCIVFLYSSTPLLKGYS